MAVVADVIAVHAARRGFQNRRGINRRDAEVGKVRDQLRGVVQRKQLVELQAVRGERRRLRHQAPSL